MAPVRRRISDSLRNPFIVIPVIAVVCVAAFGLWWVGIRSDGDSAGAATTTRTLATATSGPLSETVSAEGTVAAADTDDLSFAAAGTVTAVNVKAGDTVTAGQVLATIDSAELVSAVSAAEANVADAQATLSDAHSSGASSAQITADESSLTSANDALTTAQQNLAGASLVATFDGTVATVNLTVGEELSSSGTGGTKGTGTASGSGQSSAAIGSSSSSGLGAVVGGASSSSSSSSSTAQIQVVSAGKFTVDLAVDSADIGSVKVGQAAKVTLSTSSSSSNRFRAFAALGGFGGAGGAGTGSGSGAPSTNGSTGTGSTGSASNAASATGTVTSVSQVADASTGVATYPVTISFTSTDGNFYVGSTVTGDITTSERKNVIQVPVLAVTTTDKGSTVLVATDGTTTGATEVRTVTTGQRSNGQVEITQGLKAGEKVILSIGGFRTGTGGGFTPPSGGFPGGGEFPGGATGTGGAG